MRVLLLSLLLAGCATTKVDSPPPAEWLLDCPLPEVQAGTNGQLATTIQEHREALKQCNADKASLRAWYKN